MEDLKPYPFCGGNPHEYQMKDGLWRIFCPNCYGEMRGSHRALNREAWNRRTVIVDVTRFCEVSGL